MANYDTLDLDWSWDGDFYIGEDGDIKTNDDDLVRSLENEIQTVLKSEFDDWESHPTLGANLSDFRGEPNTRETGRAIEERVISRLTSINLVKAEDIAVRVTPTSSSQVMIAISVRAVPTPSNRLNLGERILTTLLYDTLEDSVFFIPTSKLDRDSRGF